MTDTWQKSMGLVKGTLEYHQHRHDLYVTKKLPTLAQKEYEIIQGLKDKACPKIKTEVLKESIRLQHIRIASMIKAYTAYNDSTCEVSKSLRKDLDRAYEKLNRLTTALEGYSIT